LGIRSRPAGRRPVSRRAAAPDVATPASGVGLAPGPSLASATLPRVWQGTGYRTLPEADAARRLFDFAAVAWPETATPAFCWGAHIATATGERLVGAVVAERAERAVMLFGPVVEVDAPMAGGETPEALEVAAQLVAVALDHATALGVETIFARPQGLDRIWIRYGFIPVPEGALPSALGGRQGVGLYAWRGGTALWTFRETQHD
jgi:hypothetical protein